MRDHVIVGGLNRMVQARSRGSAARATSLRALAYDVLCIRDRQWGWKPHRNRFRASCRLEPHSLQAIARARLSALLRHAYESAPYYREQWSALGFRSDSAFDESSLADLPFLTKEIIRAQREALVSRHIPRAQLELSYTGGTTGTQTAFYLDRACKLTRLGRQWGMFERCGYRPGMRRAFVWGVHTDLPPAGVRSLKAWFRKYASSDETLCCTVMEPDLMFEFHQRVQRFKPEVLHGYPSALLELARFIQERGLSPIKVNRILTTAERLTQGARARLAEAFGGEVFNLYCTREYGTVAFECPDHGGLHIDSESLWVEIVRDGRPVQPGELGEIVITDLNNYGMPFVRSRTGDMGALATSPCSCGLPWPLLQAIDGRDSEVIYRPDGRMVPGLMLTDLLMDYPGVRAQQFVQNHRDLLEVFLVVTGEFPKSGLRDVEQEIRTLVGEGMTIKIDLVERIDRNPVSGKIREVVCNLRRNEQHAKPVEPV